MATMPVSPYAASKLAAESATLAYGQLVRPPGPGLPLLQRLRPPAGGRPRLCRGGARPSWPPPCAGQPLPVHGDGRQTRDFTYVGTVAAVLTEAVVRRVTSPGPVNLAFGTRVSLLELIDMLEQRGRQAARPRPHRAPARRRPRLPGRQHPAPPAVPRRRAGGPGIGPAGHGGLVPGGPLSSPGRGPAGHPDRARSAGTESRDHRVLMTGVILVGLSILGAVVIAFHPARNFLDHWGFTAIAVPPTPARWSGSPNSGIPLVLVVGTLLATVMVVRRDRLRALACLAGPPLAAVLVELAANPWSAAISKACSATRRAMSPMWPRWPRPWSWPRRRDSGPWWSPLGAVATRP